MFLEGVFGWGFGGEKEVLFMLEVLDYCWYGIGFFIFCECRLCEVELVGFGWVVGVWYGFILNESVINMWVMGMIIRLIGVLIVNLIGI